MLKFESAKLQVQVRNLQAGEDQVKACTHSLGMLKSENAKMQVQVCKLQAGEDQIKAWADSREAKIYVRRAASARGGI